MFSFLGVIFIGLYLLLGYFTVIPALFIFYRGDTKRIWLGTCFFVALLFALGKSAPVVYDFLFNHMPMYNKFRVPSMMNLAQQAIIVIGASLFLHTLISDKLDKKKVLHFNWTAYFHFFIIHCCSSIHF